MRDQIKALEHTLEEQRVVSADFRDQDVFGLYPRGRVVEIVVLSVRNGKLLGRRNFSLKGQEFPTQEICRRSSRSITTSARSSPTRCSCPSAIDDAAAQVGVAHRRSAASATASRCMAPQRGQRHDLIKLAQKNAASSFVTRRDKSRDAEAALEKLQQRLSLKRLPRRIECFDISHIQGTATVASMVVFLDGEPAKGEYRTFKVKSATNDDFASMYEVLSRRFRRSKTAEAARRASRRRAGSRPICSSSTAARGSSAPRSPRCATRRSISA